MNKRLKYILLLIVSGLWIAGTFYRFPGVNSAGTLLSYGSGLLGIQNPDPNGETIALDGNGTYACTVKVDSFGIPHIFGNEPTDVAFGLGYQQAYDRYFQMELMTRMVEGKLAGLVGSRGVFMDTFWQKYGLEARTKTIFDQYESEQPELHATIKAYGDGVRTALAGDLGSMFEYTMVGAEPRDWEDHYVLLVPYYMTYILTYREYHQLREDALRKVPSKVLSKLYGYNRPDYPLIHPYLDVYSDDTAVYPMDTIIRLIESNLEIVLPEPAAVDWQEKEAELSKGSNNWVVSPSRSVSGHAILCNDPHLDVTLPGPWYEAHLVCDSFHTYGFTIPCSPAIISGHNEHIAWGITNCGWDLVDRYLLEVDETGANYKLDGEWIPFERETFEVEINGASPYQYEVLSTKHGYVEIEEGVYYALNWHGALDNHSAVTFYKLAKAKDVDGFVNALDHFNFPPQNFAYADVEGNIGVISAGDMPIREEGFKGGLLDGTITYPEMKYEPIVRLPYTFNPPEGFVHSANQQPERTGRYINHYWPEPYRGQRIREVLASREHHSVYSMQQLQADITDLSVRDFQAVYEKYMNQIPNADFIEQVMAWDGSMHADLHVPLRYTYLKDCVHNNFSWLLKKAYGTNDYPNYSNMLWYLRDNDTLRFGNEVMPTKDFLTSVIDTCKSLVTEELGMTDFPNHLYEEKSMFSVKHIMRIPGLGVQIAKDGSPNTPNVNSRGSHGSSMRTIIELGPEVKSWTILAGGQSGRLHSGNFSNQLEMWDQVRYRESNFSANPEDHADNILTIEVK